MLPSARKADALAAILVEIRCAAMALTGLSVFVWSFWMAGVLF